MGKNILVVDDDLVIRTLIFDCLSAFGHTVELLESGKACLTQLEQKLPDLLLVDLQMPDMNGIELIKAIQQNPATEPLKVVMLSANDSTRDLAKEAVIRVDYFLPKPFKVPQILEAIEKC